MSVTGSLLAFGVRYVFDVSADHLVETIEGRLTDHSEALSKALARANDRAWEAVGLAVAGDSFLGTVKDLFRDGDMKGVRDQIRKFLDQTDTGLGLAKPVDRAKAVEELARLRKTKRLSAGAIPLSELARQAATMERHGDPARMVAHAHQAVTDAAAALWPDAPHLAALLTAAPAGGTPLLAAAFAFFFRRELETDAELAHGLSFDFLRRISTRQESGLALLDGRTAGILDQIDVLFETVKTRFDATDEKIDDVRMGVRDLREQVNRLIGRRHVATGVTDPLKVSVTTEKELAQLRHYRDEMRKLPPELLEAADWSKLGDALAAGGLFGDAWQAQRTAAGAARAAADLAAEAEAEYKAYRASCKAERWDAALAALVRAVELDPARLAPFPLEKYRPIRILGAGGFGVVFLCRHAYSKANVVVKALVWENLDRGVDEVFAEAQALQLLDHPNIIRLHDCGYAHAAGKAGPYIVMDYFDGITLDEYVKQYGVISPDDLLPLAGQIAAGLAAAHGQGILHRDVKPANVLVRRESGWKVKLLDFGLAIRTGAVDNHASRSGETDPSQAGIGIAGSLEYAAPEQLGRLPGTPVGPGSDVYGFARTCCYALFRTPHPRRQHWTSLADPLAELFDRCLAEQPGDRPQGFEEIAQLLRRQAPTGQSLVVPAIPRGTEPSGVPVVGVPGTEESLAGERFPTEGRVGLQSAQVLGRPPVAQVETKEVEQQGSFHEVTSQTLPGRTNSAERAVAPLLRLDPAAPEVKPYEHILSIVQCRNASQLLCAYEGGTVSTWDIDLRSEKALFRIPGMPGRFGGHSSAALSLDGRLAIYASRDGTVYLWSVDQRKEMRTFTMGQYASGGGSVVCGLSRHGDMALVGKGTTKKEDITKQKRNPFAWEYSSRIWVWDTKSGKELLQEKVGCVDISSIACSPDNQVAVVAGTERSLSLWSLKRPGLFSRAPRRFLQRLEGHEGDRVAHAIFSPDGCRVISGGDDGTVRVWDVASGSQLTCLKGHTSDVLRVAISPDGRRILSASRDGTMRVWDAEDRSELLGVVLDERGEERPAEILFDVTHISFSGDGRRLLCASRLFHDRYRDPRHPRVLLKDMPLGRHISIWTSLGAVDADGCK